MKKFYTRELHRLSIGLLIILTLLFAFLLNTAVQAEEQELLKAKQVIYTFDIPDGSLDDRDVALGTSQEQLDLPSSLIARVKNAEKEQKFEVPVTWTAHPQYDRDAPGEYRFTAIPAEEYTLADHLTPPGVTVTVNEAEVDDPKAVDEREDVRFKEEKSEDRSRSNQPFSFDIASGSVVIEPDTTGQSDIQVTQGSTVTRGIDSSDTIELYSTSGATVNHFVMVKGGIETNVAANGINIKSPSGDGFSITENSTVTLTLVGNNYVQPSGSYYAGILVRVGSSLTIEDGGNGFIEARGGNYSAAIGGASSYDGTGSGDITINSGTINCYAGKWNAILGGDDANITINGGKVNITNTNSNFDKKGISADTLVLNGGTVSADGYRNRSIECSKAIINGGSLYVNSSISGTFINSAGLPVSQNRIDASSVYGPNEMVKAGELDVLMARLHTAQVPNAYSNLYGVRDVYTDSSASVYLWLPRVNMPLTDIEDPSSVKDYDNSGLPERITAKYLSTPVTLKLLNPDDYSSSAVYQWQLNGKDIEGATAQTLEAKDIGTYTLNITDGGSVSSYRQIIFSAVYTLAFDSNGGKGVMPDQTKNYGEELPLNPNEYTKTGYTFSGWKELKSGAVYPDKATLTEDFTVIDGEVVKLYAQWRANNYNVKFDGNTADGGIMADQAMTYDEAASLASNSYTKTGYTFTGWNTQGDGSGTAYGDGEKVKNLTTADGEVVKLYAQWRANKYSIQFDGNTADGGSMADQAMTYDEAASLASNSYTKTGYTFTGWNTQADGSGTAYGDGEEVKNLTTVDGETVPLYAQWRANKYSIQFDGNTADGGSMADQTMTYDEAASLASNSYTKTGYTFTGWNTQGDGSGTAYGDGEEVKNLTTVDGEVVKLYAQWRANKYSVQFDGNTADGGSMADQAMTYDAAASLASNSYTKTGYTFTGWNTQADGSGTAYGDGEEVKNLTTVDGETVPLYAQWRANKYSIQFDGNTADGGSMTDQAMTYDTAVNLTANGYTKTGYTFTGWNTQANGGGTAYTDGENVKNLTTADGETVPLYAQWRANKYSIQFEGNTADGGSMADQAMTYDEAASLERNSYTKTGYTFTGWNTQADGGGTAYGDGEEVKNLTIVDGEVVKLYAQWRLRTPSIVTSQSIGKHGDTITLTGEDFEPNAEVIFTLHSMPKEIGKAPADTDGKVTLTFQVPFDTEEGDHQLRADNGIHSAQTGLKVLKTAKADSEKIDNNTNGTPVGTGIQSHGYIPLVLVLVLCGITFGVLLRRNKLK
ncbi:InlB B-repeat-containing protein [Eubacterium callanderi]|uniref:InlB B-repeat-containing protein n=1 Tax=Eubacterium callanderi TaxID=53442 RepID=UPI0039843CA2